jgi:hypothetical protein
MRFARFLFLFICCILLDVVLCQSCSSSPRIFNFTLAISFPVGTFEHVAITNAISLALQSPEAIAALGNDLLIMSPTIVDDGCFACTSQNCFVDAAAAAASTPTTVRFFRYKMCVSMLQLIPLFVHQATIGATCSASSLAFGDAFNSSRKPFFSFSSTNAASHSSASDAPYELHIGSYAGADVLHKVGQAIAGLFYYYDWSQIAIIEGDDATSVQLRAALFESIFTTNGPVTNQTFADMYAAEHMNPSSLRYKTIWGDSAGTWQADSLKLHMDVLPTSPLPSNPFDPNLQLRVDSVVSAVLDAAANIFVFTCPLEAAQAAARKLYAADFFGYGFVVILAPHLVTPLLWQSDPILFDFFRGALTLQIQSYGASSFGYSYQAAFGLTPGTIPIFCVKPNFKLKHSLTFVDFDRA